MKNRKIFGINLIVMIIMLICMWSNRFVSPFPDIAIRVIGSVMLVDLFVLGYSGAKLKGKSE